MDTLALNYNAMATVSGLCVYSPPGCPWDTELEMWPCAPVCDADVNGDGELTIADLLSLLGDFGSSCGLPDNQFQLELGGMAPPIAEPDSLVSSAASSPGCTYETAVNYNPSATYDDGSCLLTGCLDSEAINYNAMANLEAPCIYSLPNCLWDVANGEWVCPTACAADINSDQLVNVPDLLILLGEFAVGCD